MKTLSVVSLGIGITILLLSGWASGWSPPSYENGPQMGAFGGWPGTEELPQPIVTRQTVFVIPFHLQPAQDSSQQPVEVQLYVSTDQGRQWRMYHRVRPGEGQFLVRTTGEGEYWFLVRTVDRAGRVRPQTPPRPELRVIVDTTPPKLELTAEASPDGQVTIRWYMTDRSLRPESLRIGYRTASDGIWRVVPMEGKQVQTFPDSEEGQVRWTPPAAGAGQVEIRAEVVDGAGNPAVAHAQVQLSTFQSLAGLNAPSNASLQNEQWRAMRREIPRQPSPTDAAPLGTSAGSPDTLTGPPPSGSWNAPGASAAQTDASQPPSFPSGPVASSIYPPIQGQFSPPASSLGREAGHAVSSDTPMSAQTGASPTTPPYPSTGLGASAVQEGPSTTSPSISAGSRAASEVRGASGGGDAVPSGESVRMVNSRVFELEYELGDPLPAGRVELWATRDNGRTWQCLGQDTDNRSPMVVSVPQEGVYGFRIIASADPRSPTTGPAPGEMPDVWIGVDWTRPSGRIVRIEPQFEDSDARIHIRWEASDRNLADKPISLFYSPTGASGTWTPIATGLENTGQYTWNVPATLTDRVYIRLEIRDRAGNLTVDQSAQAVHLGQRTERAKIRDVRPVNPSAKGAARGFLS